jgi:hypothetical protein
MPSLLAVLFLLVQQVEIMSAESQKRKITARDIKVV